ncbi:Hypothetical predicted protein, partial [Paramuricea clavata]
ESSRKTLNQAEELAEQTKDLRWAFELSKKAQCLAEELHFEEAVLYANRRLARLTEMLIRNALQSCSKRRLEKDLEDLLDFPQERKNITKQLGENLLRRNTCCVDGSCEICEDVK